MKENFKPFLKWVGGKTQLLDVILPLIPEKYDTYVEPFLGGGAIFFALAPKKAIINDFNTEIINAIDVIKNDKNELYKLLNLHVENHNGDYYYQIRNSLNNDVLSNVQRAANFIYLNKTGFNGLYRVNSKGELNVPFGKKDSISISTLLEKNNSDKISNYLNESEITIFNKSYLDLEKHIQNGDFVFIDPPYDSDNDKSFDSYTKNSFGKDGQNELAEFLKRLDKIGVKWMLTNHNTELINNLYKDYTKFLIPVNRFINSDANNRMNATYETIIINYKISIKQELDFKKQLFYKELKTSSYVLKNYISWDEIKIRNQEIADKISDLELLFSPNEEEFFIKFENLYNERKESLSILPFLLAKRLKKDDKFTYIINDKNEIFDYQSKENIINFLKESGLIENLFISEKNKDLNTYLLGLEVGLTSNDKKNKSGLYMVKKIEEILKNKNIEYQVERSYDDVLKLNLADGKRFDFWFTIDSKEYCLECNFFNSSGSKINSEAKRFMELNHDFKKYTNLHFIWVTDGEGLKKSKNIIDKAIDEVEHLYNLVRFEEFINNLCKKQNN